MTPNPDAFTFTLTQTDGRARAGVMTTPHGRVETPAFMAVGTQGAVKGITFRDLESLGSQILLSNTYHLYLRPGDDLIARRGGLHRFIGWNKPILTDSGGYQVFSLSDRRTIDETGVRFKSHLDGSSHLLTPEKAADIQAQLGSDIAMVLDECLAYPATAETARESMARTVRWAARARERQLALRAGHVAGVTVTNPGQAQFGIVQGGVFPELRRESAEATAALGFEGYAIGGLSVGEPPPVMYDIVGGRSSALSDGCRNTRGSARVGGARHRSVRLCAPDAQCPQRSALHERREDQHQERSLRRGRPAPRSRLRLLYLSNMFAGVSAPSFSSRRDQRIDP
jgi:queuine tRNA-ribosyltransferase